MTLNSIGNFLNLYDESVLRRDIRTNLIDWATDVMASSGQTPAAHHRLLLHHLDLITKGEIKRLMVLMPPGSAKSTYASVIFPIWWLMQHPRSSVIAVSHTISLVEHFSRRIHALIEENRHKIGFGLRGDNRSASHWQTSAGGEYFAVGVRGAVTGRRADLVIIDDPIKSMAEADSPKQRQHIWDWYASELTTRLKPDARIVLIMTRWHDQDLGGQLIAHGGEEWRILRLPAIAEDDDPIGRPPGAPLWPEWESLEALNKKRVVVGNRLWSALYQQSPHPAVGRLFNIGLLQAIDLAQPDRTTAPRSVRAWDLAATPASGDNDPDWTVGLKLALHESGRYVIEDIVRFRSNYKTVQETIVSVARSDGHAVVISLPIDPGQAGKAQIAQLSSLLGGYRIYTSREQGSKLSRAMPVAAQLDSGNLAIQRGPPYQAFVEELAAFPQGDKDDQVDALSRAFITLSDFPNAGRRIYLPYNAR
jgi:predicted phage terminase large subunit-like protein